ncbi:hypothetical protein CL176_05735 [Suicoccus acidiformans]|uniref:Uncharacterized protein n=1 Tax=Suicoccus acidiformans TaxID=2036206 RepID=A0A347WKC6_9LACT|nr:hypothetical protein CL176_05735 [Suicoccus acidiformans]
MGSTGGVGGIGSIRLNVGGVRGFLSLNVGILYFTLTAKSPSATNDTSISGAVFFSVFSKTEVY